MSISLKYIGNIYDAVSYLIMDNDTSIGKIDIILNSPFFKEHNNDKGFINEVSIVVDKESRNKGYGYEALKLLIEEYKFSDMTNELWSIVHVENIPSRKLHEKLMYIQKKEHLKFLICVTEKYVCYRLA